MTRVLIEVQTQPPKAILGLFTLSSIIVDAKDWPGTPKGRHDSAAIGDVFGIYLETEPTPAVFKEKPKPVPKANAAVQKAPVKSHLSLYPQAPRPAAIPHESGSLARVSGTLQTYLDEATRDTISRGVHDDLSEAAESLGLMTDE